MENAISSALREEIQLKMDKIAGRPRYYDERQKLVVENLRSIGDVYSFWIENPELRKALLTEHKQPKTLRKEARDGIHAVHNGWYFLSEKGKYGNFVEIFDEATLKKLNALVHHRKTKKSKGLAAAGKKALRFITGQAEDGFRREDVTLSIPGYTPPSWEKVPEQVRELIAKIKESYKQDPLESAILSHLGIAAVQPFMEGNKRCARLVQDRILYDAKMPPAIIPAGEGKFYFGLLARTLPAYRDRSLEGQRQFYDFCASKVNNGLDEILGDLQEEPEITNRHNLKI